MRDLKSEELEFVVGGTELPPPPAKGNNGFGNGAEGINNGSDNGGTRGSKFDEVRGPNDGPGPDKFTFR